MYRGFFGTVVILWLVGLILVVPCQSSAQSEQSKAELERTYEEAFQEVFKDPGNLPHLTPKKEPRIPVTIRAARIRKPDHPIAVGAGSRPELGAFQVHTRAG